MDSKCLEAISILEVAMHVLRKGALYSFLTVWAPLDFRIDMLNNFFKNDIDFCSPLMFMAGNFIQWSAASITSFNLGNSDSFQSSGIADLAANAFAFTITLGLWLGSIIFSSLRRWQTGVFAVLASFLLQEN